MKNQNILCCLNENPIFVYHSIYTDQNELLEQIIINYITKNYQGKRWLRKESCFVDNVKFVYYEIQLETALKRVKKKSRYQYDSIERFCLSFLNFFLEKTPTKLLSFLRKIAAFTESELEEIEKEFNTENSK